MKRKSYDRSAGIAVRNVQKRDHGRMLEASGNKGDLRIAAQWLVESLNGEMTLSGLVRKSYFSGEEIKDKYLIAQSRMRILGLLELVKSTSTPDRRSVEARSKVCSDITNRMKAYASYPTRVFDVNDNRWVTIQQPFMTNRHPWDSSDSTEKLVASRLAVARYPFGEIKAAHAIFELLEMGMLNRIRQCKCGVWFFARTSTQSSHSSRCRQRRYESTEGFKRRRSEYLKARYRNIGKGGKAKITPQTKKRAMGS